MIAEKMEGTLAALLPEIYLKVKCADLVAQSIYTHYSKMSGGPDIF